MGTTGNSRGKAAATPLPLTQSHWYYHYDGHIIFSPVPPGTYYLPNTTRPHPSDKTKVE